MAKSTVMKKPRKKVSLAARLRWAAKQGRVSQRELAGLADISPSAPGAILRGEAPNPQVGTVEALASVLGISLDWVVKGIGPEPTAEQIRAAVEAARGRRQEAA